MRSEQRAERQAAYRAIAALEGEARSDGVSLLTRELRRWESTLGRATRKTEGLVAGYDRVAEARAELLARWEEAAQSALAAIFDEQLFPMPLGPIHGPHEGYQEVMARVRPAAELFDDLRSLADKDLKGALRLERDEALSLLDDLRGSSARASELVGVLASLGQELEPPARPAGLALAVLCIAAGDWRTARHLWLPHAPVESGPYAACQVDRFPADPAGSAQGPEGEALQAGIAPLEGYERFLYHHALAAQIEAYNAEVDVPVPQAVRVSVAGINDHRRALGLRPLQLHPALTRAIRDHLWTLRELMHEGGTDETRTAADRIRASGYVDAVATGENLCTGDSAVAVEQWKWDGGHYRILADPCAVHVGAFQAAFSGMVVAAGEAPVLPSLSMLALTP